MAKSNLHKVGTLIVPDGTYTDKNGNEKTRYHEIGTVFATPHHSRMCIKFHANGFGEGQFANIVYDKGSEPHFNEKKVQVNNPDEVDF